MRSWQDALRTAKAVDHLLSIDTEFKNPFDKIVSYIQKGILREHLKTCGIGQYNRLTRCLEESIRNCHHIYSRDLDGIESIYGVGPKTSRFFIVYTKPDQEYAIIDTHVLKYLKELGYDVPKTTPTGKKYRELETIFLNEWKKSGLTLTDFDLGIWKRYAGHGG